MKIILMKKKSSHQNIVLFEMWHVFCGIKDVRATVVERHDECDSGTLAQAASL